MFILYPTRMIIVKDSVGKVITRILPNTLVKNSDKSKSISISRLDDYKIYGHTTDDNGELVEVEMDIDSFDDFMFGEDYTLSVFNTIDWVLYSVETREHYLAGATISIISVTKGITQPVQVIFKEVKRGNSGTNIILEYPDGRGTAFVLNNPGYTASTPLKDIKYIPFFEDYQCI